MNRQEAVLAALQAVTEATAPELAEMLCVSEVEARNAVHPLKRLGKVQIVGHRRVKRPNRTFLLPVYGLGDGITDTIVPVQFEAAALLDAWPVPPYSKERGSLERYPWKGEAVAWSPRLVSFGVWKEAA